MKGVIYVANSHNSKIDDAHKVDATYVSIKASCPASCTLRNAGCYAQNSYVGVINARLEKQAKNLSAYRIALEEAKAIDNAYGGKKIPENRNLRLHVSGDSTTIKGTKAINDAVGRWKKRGGGHCWSYTQFLDYS